jgi:mono/diheme cytochrome c family protein
MNTTKLLPRVAIGAIIVFAGIQVVPYGRNHTNPPIVQEPAWNPPETRALAKRACFDCHSNETQWPWYSNIAPVSWLTERDTLTGRSKMNFSEWNRPQKKADDAAEEVQKGEMPLWFYTPIHPEAKLTPTEKEALIAGLRATIGQRGEKSSKESEEREH